MPLAREWAACVSQMFSKQWFQRNRLYRIVTPRPPVTGGALVVFKISFKLLHRHRTWIPYACMHIYPWIPMDIHARISMDTHGHPCLHISMHGYRCMDIHPSTSIPMDIHPSISDIPRYPISVDGAQPQICSQKIPPKGHQATPVRAWTDSFDTRRLEIPSEEVVECRM